MNFINQILRCGLKPLNLFCLSRLFSLGLGLAFLGLTPFILSAATLDDLKFTLINSDTEYSVSAKDPKNIAGTLDIPATYNGKPVTEIGSTAFGILGVKLEDYPDITSVTIPSSIKVIKSWAFAACYELTEVNFAPDSQLTTFEDHTFFDCSALTSINLPKSLTSIGSAAFSYNYKLPSIEIPEAVTSIENNAFLSCKNLASVTFHGSAPTLGENVFQYTGSDVGGFTINIFDTHEASYASWRDLYTFNVISSDPVTLYAETSYNPNSKALSIITKNEDTSVALNLQNTASLSDAWTTLSTTDYAQSTNADTGAVTRTITLDPDTIPTGFYRLVSEGSSNTN